MSRIFVFPGQGSQTIGMGKALAENFSEAREVFDEVDQSLGQHLFKLMGEGPESDLNLTENTQPALMAVSVATARVILKQSGKKLSDLCQYVAGHSLGEYSALTVAGTFSLSNAAKLLKLRGQSMQRAVPVGQGAMAAILGLDLPDVQKLAIDAAAQVNNGEVCTAANDNSGGQVVVSGHVAAVNAAVAMAPARGAKRAIVLPVSAPFHCPLMQPAADAMRDALVATKMNDPAVPVIANVTADAVTQADVIRGLLVDQVTGMVRWRESVHRMKGLGVTQAVELGAGKVLSGLIKRIEPDIVPLNAGTPEEIEAVLTAMVG